MKKLLFLVVILSFSLCLVAQSRKSFSVNPGKKIVEEIPITDIYRYAEFKMGEVSLKNGTAANVKLNYNSVFGEMQYIDPKNGDTLSLAEEKNIKFIAVEKDTFYFDEGWLELIGGTSTVRIAKKKLLEITNREKIGAMEVAGFGAIETYNKYTGSQHMKDLVAKEKLTFTEHVSYYFGDRFNHYSRANRKGLLKLYGDSSEKIDKWISENKIDLSNEDDLKKLSVYLQSL
ncbi:MAG TPA: hypothetical protein VGQ04_18610 [Chitinophagaceae bacterium]|nr:hypothetical protein [Chitinophagaceae bacterium]